MTCGRQTVWQRPGKVATHLPVQKGERHQPLAWRVLGTLDPNHIGLQATLHVLLEQITHRQFTNPSHLGQRLELPVRQLE